MTKDEAMTIMGTAAVLGAARGRYDKGSLLLAGMRISVIPPSRHHKNDWRISLGGSFYSKFTTCKKRIIKAAEKIQ